MVTIWEGGPSMNYSNCDTRQVWSNLVKLVCSDIRGSTKQDQILVICYQRLSIELDPCMPRWCERRDKHPISCYLMRTFWSRVQKALRCATSIPPFILKLLNNFSRATLNSTSNIRLSNSLSILISYCSAGAFHAHRSDAMDTDSPAVAWSV